MKKYISLLLAAAMLLSLAACSLNLGNRDSQTDPEKDQQSSGVQSQEPDIPDASPAPSAPSTAPDQPDEPQPEPGPDKPEDNPAVTEAAVTASHSDVTLKTAGETFRLLPIGVEGVYAAEYASADPAVADVDNTDGTVTAVAPGNTKVTLHVECSSGQYDFECIIRCAWKEEEAPSQPEAPGGSSAAPSSKPSLNDFYATLQGSYEGLGAMMVLDGELLDNYYPGLSGIAAVEEVLVQETMISISNVAVGLVRLRSDATLDDVIAVQNALQGRISAQAAGGAFYPESCETWEQGIVTSVSNYVGMFVYPAEAQDMESLFVQTYGN